jgi:hypothetical protein
MCDLALTYPDYAESVQTVIHELSHFANIANTNDNAYGESTCHNLAQTNKVQARKTADTFGYYALYSNMCYRNAPDAYTVAVPPCKDCTAGTGSRGPNDCSSISNIVAPARESHAPDDSCEYAGDNICDEPTYCSWNTDHTDCGTVHDPTIIHTQAPTTAPPQLSCQFSSAVKNRWGKGSDMISVLVVPRQKKKKLKWCKNKCKANAQCKMIAIRKRMCRMFKTTTKKYKKGHKSYIKSCTR